MNHYGVLVELESGKKYMIHNSPNNLYREGTNPEHGHEIIISEDAIAQKPHKWEVQIDWYPVEANNLTISKLIDSKIKYKFFTTNCIHTTDRVWRQLVPDVQFRYMLDRKGLEQIKSF
jgi:hypothetical protein